MLFWVAGTAAQPQPVVPAPAPGTFAVQFHEKGSSRVSALLHGVGRFDLRTSQQVLETVELDYFDETGRTNLAVFGTNCLYDFRSRTAVSPEPLRILTGDRRLDLRGVGFIWWQTNNDLIISNDVRTLVRKRPSLGPGEQPDELLEVKSDRFMFQYESNLVTYSDGVRLTDPRFEMACSTLLIRRSTSNTLEKVVASGNVIVSNRLDRGLTTAEHAVYVLADDEESLELTGTPQWTDGMRRAQAERFVLDRRRNILTAVGSARLTLPIASESEFALFASPAPSPSSGSGQSAKTIDLNAGLVRLDLPRTNAPVRRLVAETNVLIVDRVSGSRVTAARALLEGESRIVLTGQPVWTSSGRTLRSEWLSYDGGVRELEARTNVIVSLPVASLGNSLALHTGVIGHKASVAVTNYVVEIQSHELVFREGWLRFGPAVTGVCRAEHGPVARLTCATLGLKYSNMLECIEATGGFTLIEEARLSEDGTKVSRQFKGHMLSLAFHTNGALEGLTAEGDVEVISAVSHPKTPRTVEKRLDCGSLEVTLRPGSNFVEQALARNRVILRDGGRKAEGERAHYSDTTGLVSLTGKPAIELPEGRITDAEKVTWERATGKYRVTGRFQSRWKNLPLGTNLANLLPVRQDTNPLR